MTANARVFTKLDLSASDNASSKIKGVRDELRSLNKQAAANSDTSHRARAALDEFGRAGDRTADTSGKLSTALSSLGDFAGSMEGDMRRASEAAGLLDDVMTVLPGPIGIAAGALTGLATVLVLNRVESQRTRAAIAEVAKPGTVDQIKELADAFGLSREASVELARALKATDTPASEVRERVREIVEQADRVGRDSTQDIKAFALSLNTAEKQAAATAARLAKVGIKLAEVREYGVGGKDVLGTRKFLQETNELLKTQGRVIEGAQENLRRIRLELNVSDERFLSFDKREKLEAARAKVREATARRDQIMAAQAKAERVAAIEQRERQLDLEREYQDEVKKAEENRKKILAARARDRAKGAREPKIDTVVERASTQRDDEIGFGDSEPLDWVLKQEALARAELTEQKRKEAEATLELAAAKAEMDRALRSNLTRLQEEARQLDEGQIRQAEAVKDAYFGAAKGLLQAAASTVKSERIRNAALAVSAAGDAAYYTAQGFAARLPQRKIQLFAAAGQAAIAAGIYGGKAVLGGRGGGGGGGGGAGGGSRALTAEGGGREGGGETTINVNFPGFVVGRQEEIGKQLKSLTAPLAGTGYGT